jgi:IS5 family transposase
MLMLLLEKPTDDSVEVALGFLEECGLKLNEVSPRGLKAVFDRLRHVLHEDDWNKRVKDRIEVMLREGGFKVNPAVLKELNLVQKEDQFTHRINLPTMTTTSLDAQYILSKKILMLCTKTIFNSLLRRFFPTRPRLRGERGEVQITFARTDHFHHASIRLSSHLCMQYSSNGSKVRQRYRHYL